jgi:hypothetical protein
MGTECERTKAEVRNYLDYRDGHLCVVAERSSQEGSFSKTARLWYPVRKVEEAETRSLACRPVTEIDASEGIYVDEEGTVFQLVDRGETKPLLVEEGEEPSGDLEHLLNASLRNGKSSTRTRTHALQRTKGPRKKRAGDTNEPAKPNLSQPSPESVNRQPDPVPDWCGSVVEQSAQLNLRQKLAEVRRRIGYIQKRGFNEHNNYSYVTAADLAGAVGDILAELGVVIVPQLESITYEPSTAARTEVSRAAQVVMAYTFADVDTEEEITTKVAGQGLDSGDKAPYKAMTGALKYALLQSFLLATGDDPEEERINHASSSERPITAEEVRQLRALIDETGTEPDRVLAYYRINSFEEMREGSYRRALELLLRKRTRRAEGSHSHAQD